MAYFLGHQRNELERLALQAQLLNPVTSRLLDQTGLGDAMRVLDIGCGPGDVALLASERTGSQGQVVGIDQNADAIALANSRLSDEQAARIAFYTTTFDAFTSAQPFDLVIARYVLIHQTDPVAFLRKAASLVRPGGVLALHEIAFQAPIAESQPAVALWDQAGHWIAETMRMNAPSHDIATRLNPCFQEAGLDVPGQFRYRHTGGGEDTLLYAWAAETLRTAVPHLVRAGVVSEQEVGLDTYEQRLRDATLRARSQLKGPWQICVWLKLPEAC